MTPATILIVEDNAAHLRALTDRFEDLGHVVHGAMDGDTGLTRALELKPDIMILDIMLPRRSGYEVCEALRVNNLAMPIIMLTAKDREQDVIQGLELGADDYVTKPFRINELVARVSALLRRHGASRAAELRFDGFLLDVAARQLLRDGTEVVLTRKEFDLLLCFLERPNRALTRNQIMKSVWGGRIIVTPRSVDRCITTLRAKIEPDPSRPRYILTIRDIGYRFRNP